MKKKVLSRKFTDPRLEGRNGGEKLRQTGSAAVDGRAVNPSCMGKFGGGEFKVVEVGQVDSCGAFELNNSLLTGKFG